ncbi:hypothetical protein E2C01_086443 [Portunus trituberculatus]|uniref:Uncharacterized protein n=1 Tax=Portunus trituberculatus TaxID=210409 RepID=A0A5B7JEL2_PORTR|nr:hypothetical protein [Portunus trituberculatus]
MQGACLRVVLLVRLRGQRVRYTGEGGRERDRELDPQPGSRPRNGVASPAATSPGAATTHQLAVRRAMSPGVTRVCRVCGCHGVSVSKQTLNTSCFDTSAKPRRPTLDISTTDIPDAGNGMRPARRANQGR